MIEILYTKFTKPLPEILWKKFLSELPPELQEKNARYVRWQDRHSNLLGKQLLIRGLKKYGYDSGVLAEMKYSKYGKPMLDLPIEFNISHAGEYVVCAMSKEAHIGIDIEEIKEIDFEDFNNVMTESQWHVITDSIHPTERFFKFWTIKESVIKIQGDGLSVPLKEIDILSDELAVLWKTNWYLFALDFEDDYHCTVSCNKPDATFNTLFIPFHLEGHLN